MITAYMMNYLLSSGKGCVQVLVMTKEIEKMKTMILNDMDAGVTLLDGKTGFLKENTEVVLTILPYRKLPDLKDKIKEIDDKAFIIDFRSRIVFVVVRQGRFLPNRRQIV